MKGYAVLLGLLGFLLLGMAHFAAGLSTAVCWIFAVVFWGSVGALACCTVLGVIGGLFCGDAEVFGNFMKIGACVFAIGVCVAVCVFLCAVVVDFARSIAHVTNLTDETEIRFSHLLFPWTRP